MRSPNDKPIQSQPYTPPELEEAVIDHMFNEGSLRDPEEGGAASEVFRSGEHVESTTRKMDGILEMMLRGKESAEISSKGLATLSKYLDGHPLGFQLAVHGELMIYIRFHGVAANQLERELGRSAGGLYAELNVLEDDTPVELPANATISLRGDRGDEIAGSTIDNQGTYRFADLSPAESYSFRMGLKS